MDTVCTKCGTIIPEGNAFCTECGTPAPKADETPKKEKESKKEKPEKVKKEKENKKTKESEKEVAVEKTPISENVFRNDTKPLSKPVHPVAFFFLILLYLIPVVGLVGTIAFLTSAKNDNIVNFSKAVFAWKVIIDVLILAAVVAFFVLLHNKGISVAQFNVAVNEALAPLK